MQIAFAFARKHLAGAAAVLFAAALAVSFVLPVQAHALDVERWTAKPNKDGDNTTVLGATATRVTWQGQTAEDESLASVTIEMPEGTTVGAENVKTTVLVGLDRLHLFFDPAIIVTSVPALFAGWLVSIGVVVVSFPLAIPLGLLLSFLRMAKHRLPRAIGATYINIVRGTPLFLQLYIAFFGLPLMGVQMDNFTMGAIVLVMNSSAYLAEIFRAGIQSISQGQFEAARSLGMNGAQTMFFVIIPQTVRRVIPTMTSEFILMYKDTSLLAAVGVTELMMYAKTITAATGNVTPYIVAAGFYLIVTIPLTKLINTMEARMSNGRRKHKKGPADRSITSAASVVPDSDAGVARSIRLSETFAGPASQTDAATRIYEDAKRNGNHISH